MRITPLLCVLLASLSIAASDLGPPRFFLPPEELAGSPFSSVAAATDGTNYLMVGTRDNLHYAVLLDGAGQQITAPVFLPDVEDFRGVVWADNFFVIGGSGYVRFDANGKLLDPFPRALPHDPSIAKFSFASNGHRILFITPLDSTGQFLDGNGIAKPVLLPDGMISVASDGSDFGLVSYSRLWVVNSAGAAVRNVVPETKMPMFDAEVESDGNSWVLRRGDDLAIIYDKQLRRLAEYPLAMSGYPGRGYFAQGSKNPFIGVVELLPPAYTPVATPVAATFWNVIGATHDSILFATYASFEASLYLLTSTAQAGSLPPPLVTRGVPVDRSDPIVVDNRNGVSLVVWRERRAGSLHVRAARMTARGERLDVTPIEIGTGCLQAKPPVAATDGQGFLVAWQDCADTAITQISAGGAVTGQGRIELAHDQSETALAFDGSNYVLLHTAYYDGRESIYATKISPDFVFGVRVLSLLNAYSFRAASNPDGGISVVANTLAGLTPGTLSSNDLRIAVGASLPLVSFAVFGQLYPNGDEMLFEYTEVNTIKRVSTDRLLRLSTRGWFIDTSAAGRVLDQQGTLHCEETCTMLWKETTSGGPSKILGVTLDGDARPSGEPVVLATFNSTIPTGAPVAFFGTLAEPKLLLYQAVDRDQGGVQLFVRNIPTRRRSAR